MKKIAVLFVFFFSTCAFAQMVGSFVMNPVGDFKARTDSVKGSATMSGGKVFAKNIVIDLNTLKTGLDLRDHHGKEKYLEVAKYPTATLVSAQGQGGKGTGKLTLHGVTHDIAGTYEVANGRLTAHFPIKLSDFKIADISYKGVGVEDEAKIDVTVPITGK